MTPEERSRKARIGAYARAAQYDGRVVTRRAREAFLAKFEQEVDPDGVLAPEERARRAEAAKKSYMLRLAERSVKARKAQRTN